MKTKFEYPEGILFGLSGGFLSLTGSVYRQKYQLLIATQYKPEECQVWGNALIDLSKNNQYFPNVKGIMEKLVKEPDFALQDIRFNTIVSTIFALTSAYEHYLKEVILDCMSRSKSLRLKGLSDRTISARLLEENENTVGIKNRLLTEVATEHSKGGLFSNKFTKVCKYLEVEVTALEKRIQDNLDSIWELRNILGHTSHETIQEINLKYYNGNLQLKKRHSSDEYFDFILPFLDIFNDCLPQLMAFDSKLFLTWNSEDNPHIVALDSKE